MRELQTTNHKRHQDNSVVHSDLRGYLWQQETCRIKDR